MDDKLTRLISSDEHDRVMRPIETAMTPPACAYSSDDWFALERERIFQRHWMGILFECQIPSPGDVLPLEFLDMPLLAVRGDDGRVRVFHNICPYDGCLVATRPKQGCKHLEVLYHGWRYNLSGRLITAPYWNGDRGCSAADMINVDTDLAEVRSEVRQGVLFVNLNGKAESIDLWLAPWRQLVSQHFAIDLLEPARFPDGRPWIEERTVQANWKTYQENASINILHEAFTHDLYRKSDEVPRVNDHREPQFKTWCDGALAAFSHHRDDSGDTYDPINLPTAGHDPSRQPAVGYFSTIYPNINVPLLDAMIKVNIAIPVSAGETRLLHLRFYRPEALADPRFQTEEHAIQNLFDVIHGEDRVAIEAVQQARRSPAFSQHPYAPFWDILHHYFNQLVMRDLNARNSSHIS